MKTIKIEWLTDTFDCEVCGESWAEGAYIIFPDGEELLLEPLAHCYGGESYETDQVYDKVLEKLGYKVEHESIWD